MRHGRVDVTQKAIAQALRDVGARVEILSDVGNGIPDLLVGYRGVTYLLECKSDAKAKLTPAQVAFFAEWRGGPAKRVNNVTEALAVIGIGMTKKGVA